MHVYRFEGIGEELELVPLAARRALDTARVKVSLNDWKSASLAFRRAIVELGSALLVDALAVRREVSEASVPASEAAPFEDVSADAIPEGLVALVSLTAWRELSPLDRYTLTKVARGKSPEEVLPRAVAEIAPLSTHVGASGEAHMVDVGAKIATVRRAVARACVTMEGATAARLRAGDVAKGDVFATARIAGIQAAKRTPELIPLCHSVALTRVTIDLRVVDEPAPAVIIDAAAEATDRTGVEMEALTAASVAALTVYDMLKSTDRGMRIAVELEEKSGGTRGDWARR